MGGTRCSLQRPQRSARMEKEHPLTGAILKDESLLEKRYFRMMESYAARMLSEKNASRTERFIPHLEFSSIRSQKPFRSSGRGDENFTGFSVPGWINPRDEAWRKSLGHPCFIFRRP